MGGRDAAQGVRLKRAGADRGLLPTTAFWKRRDVWRIAGPPTGVFVFLWLMMLDLFVIGSTPMWASAMLAGVGPYLFVAILERYLRARLRRRRSLELPPQNKADDPAQSPIDRHPLMPKQPGRSPLE